MNYYCGKTGKVPVSGVDLIKSTEGFRHYAYPDPITGREPITIGWGFTKRRDGSNWRMGDYISKEDANELLIELIERDYLPSLQKIPVWNQLNPNQQGALLSFAWNLGADFYGNFNNFATITRLLDEKDWSRNRVISTFILYRNKGSAVEEGLKARRIAEAELFLTPFVEHLTNLHNSQQLSLISGSATARFVIRVTAKQTWLKYKVGSADSLPASEKVLLLEGDEIVCTTYQDDDNHIRVMIDLEATRLPPNTASQINKRLGWWRLFKEHVLVESLSPISLTGSTSLLAEQSNIKVTSSTRLSGLSLGNGWVSQIVKACLERGDLLDVGKGFCNIIYVEGADEYGNLIAKTPDAWFSRRLIVEIIDGKPFIRLNARANTCPGVYYVKNPLNRLGGAYIKLIQQRDAWVLGSHGTTKRHPALQQVGKIIITRDLNKDFSRIGDKEYVGSEFAINHHWGYGLVKVGKASAGCPTAPDWNGHMKFINLLKSDKRISGSPNRRWTATFIDASEVKKK
jgi:GH24 family phage-related lysozyme (muramidase)